MERFGKIKQPMLMEEDIRIEGSLVPVSDDYIGQEKVKRKI